MILKRQRKAPHIVSRKIWEHPLTYGQQSVRASFEKTHDRTLTKDQRMQKPSPNIAYRGIIPYWRKIPQHCRESNPGHLDQQAIGLSLTEDNINILWHIWPPLSDWKNKKMRSRSLYSIDNLESFTYSLNGPINFNNITQHINTATLLCQTIGNF